MRTPCNQRGSTETRTSYAPGRRPQTFSPPEQSVWHSGTRAARDCRDPALVGGYNPSPVRSHFGDLESFPASTILNTKERPILLPFLCSPLHFFLPRLVAHEKRSPRHPDPRSARGVVCLDLSQARQRAPALLGYWLDPGLGSFHCPVASCRIDPVTGVRRHSGHQHPAPIRAIFPFLRLRHPGIPVGQRSGSVRYRSPGAFLHQLPDL